MNNAKVIQQPSILITRPEPEATAFLEALKPLGWSPRALPLVEFIPNRPNLRLEQDKPSIIIPISPRAIEFGFAWLHENSSTIPSDPEIQWYTLGPKSAETLQHWGIKAINDSEEGINSEQLLQHPSLLSLPKDTQCLILKGIGGRQLLSATLTNRGYKVIEANVYKRRMPRYTAQVLSWALHPPLDCITVTSGEILQTLVSILKNQLPALPVDNTKLKDNQNWQEIPLMVVGERQKTMAVELGFKSVFVAPNASLETLVKTLRDDFPHKHSFFEYSKY